MTTSGPGPSHSPSAGPAHHACRNRLARRVVGLVGEDGLIRAACESRVLESALLLHLCTELAPRLPARARLTDHLRRTLRAAPPDPVQAAVARAALGERATGEAGTAAALSDFAHFTAGRKQLMFTTLLAELGAARWPRVPLHAYDGRGRQSWLALEMTALKVLAAYGTGRVSELREDDWRALAPALWPDRIWEANYLARLLGLLALGRDPGRRPAVIEAVARTAQDLRPDGGLPFITGMDIFTTALAGLALTACGPAPGVPLARMADALAARQLPDGGFGFTRDVRQSDTDDTAYCLEFLRATGPSRYAEHIHAAEDRLAALRNEDGGFPTFARGTASEVAMTAGAVNALAPGIRHRRLAEEGFVFLADAILSGRQPERSWSRSIGNVLFRTVLACRTMGPSPRTATVRTRALDQLLGARGPDGLWGHTSHGPADPVSTAYATVALAAAGPADSARAAAPLRACVDYLTAHQRPDGGFDSMPDQSGPRPLLYDVPVLTDVCVLLGLGYASRLQPVMTPGLSPGRPRPGRKG
ncbi:prenyltransferase/squalene oxidase repeat-containing protein [Streptomyces sp. NPDC004610]|uniref:prenyltransferase/squalene oxidase repeat-containing protein n=1 Tax=unclassified Streptomyces TaxID=2593676 RepID=UPI0033B9F1E4